MSSLEPTYPCICGAGRGWIELGDNTVKPCERCRPELWRLWRDGKFRPSLERRAQGQPRPAVQQDTVERLRKDLM